MLLGKYISQGTSKLLLKILTGLNMTDKKS